MVHPFCIELTYDEKAQMNKKYHARRIERVKLTPEIERLIRGEAPDLEPATRFFNQKNLRAFLERYAVVDLPWDRIFDVPKLVVEKDEEGAGGDGPGEEEPRRESKDREERKPTPEVGRSRRAEAPPPPPPPSSKSDVDMIPCDKCKTPMREDAAICKKCGAVYTFDDDEPEKPTGEPGKKKGDKVPFDFE